jgi:hypothetical protein
MLCAPPRPVRLPSSRVAEKESGMAAAVVAARLPAAARRGTSIDTAAAARRVFTFLPRHVLEIAFLRLLFLQLFMPSQNQTARRTSVQIFRKRRRPLVPTRRKRPERDTDVDAQTLSVAMVNTPHARTGTEYATQNRRK